MTFQKKYCFDIDGTICQNTFGKYELARPIQERIDYINALFDSGCEIIMFTARGSTTGIDWKELTKSQLKSWGLKYSKLILGKPDADIFIDDKALEANYFFNKIFEDNKENYFLRLANFFNILHNNKNIYEKIDLASKELAESFKNGGKLFIAGNGGSFADAQHLCAEFTSKLVRDRIPLPAILLGGNSSTLTAIGNDYGFEKLFVREFQSLATNKDILLTITTSGESQNIIELLEYALSNNFKTWCLTSGKDSSCSRLSRTITTPLEVNQVANIQELHIAIGHLLCFKTEHYYFN